MKAKWTEQTKIKMPLNFEEKVVIPRRVIRTEVYLRDLEAVARHLGCDLVIEFVEKPKKKGKKKEAK